MVSLSYTRLHNSVENSEIPLVLLLNGDIDGRMEFSPILCVFIPSPGKYLDFAVETCCSSPGWARVDLGVCSEGYRELQIHPKLGCFSLWFLQYQLCFTSHGFLLLQKQGFLCRCLLLPTTCPRVWAWSCYQDSFKISLYNHFHHSKEKWLPVAESRFQHPPLSQRKKKANFFGWLVFFLSKGGCSKIICYILPSMVKGSTQCSCTLLVLSETISIPTFYLTSHLSSASHAVVQQWRPSCDLQGRLLCHLLLFLTTVLGSQLQSCARVCVTQCGCWFEPPMAHPWGQWKLGKTTYDSTMENNHLCSFHTAQEACVPL